MLSQMTLSMYEGLRMALSRYSGEIRNNLTDRNYKSIRVPNGKQ